MKVVNIDDNFTIYPDSVKTYDCLPAKCYRIEFSKMQGFYLVLHSNLEVKEKVYGDHKKKVQKILSSFDRIKNRSLGAIASGKKGIGKSLLFRLLAQEVNKKGMPVVIVDKYYPGIANYIESIEQECMVLFDEFDKTFAELKAGDNASGAQTELLGLFDGTAMGKKLFAITCNDIYKISEFLVNRPGRFLYHFRFEEPDSNEIIEYMHDKIGFGEWQDRQISEVVRFSKKVPLNYDCLNAICFELESGTEFKEAIQDLNIINTETRYYSIKLYYENGQTASCASTRINMFGTDKETAYVNLDNGENLEVIFVSFDIRDAVYMERDNEYVIDGEKLHLDYDECEGSEKLIEKYKKIKPDRLSIRMQKDKQFHYTV